jgi:hypothetical protein
MPGHVALKWPTLHSKLEAEGPIKTEALCASLHGHRFDDLWMVVHLEGSPRKDAAPRGTGGCAMGRRMRMGALKCTRLCVGGYGLEMPQGADHPSVIRSQPQPLGARRTLSVGQIARPCSPSRRTTRQHACTTCYAAALHHACAASLGVAHGPVFDQLAVHHHVRRADVDLDARRA